MRALFVTTGLFAAALLMTGCADLERASRPADARGATSAEEDKGE